MTEFVGDTAGTTGPGEGAPGEETYAPPEVTRRDPAEITQEERPGLGPRMLRRIDPMEFPEGSTMMALGATPPDQAWRLSLARKQTIVGGAMRRILQVLGPAVPHPGIHDADGLITTRIVAILKEVYHAGEFYGRSAGADQGFNNRMWEFESDFQRFRHHTDERLDNLFGQYRTILRRLETLTQQRIPPVPEEDRRTERMHERFDRAMRDVMGEFTDPPLGGPHPGGEVPREEPLPERLDTDDILGPGSDLIGPEESPHVVGGI